MSDARKLSRKLFSKRVDTGETKPNPTLRQFETYEISPLRSDVGGKFFGFKGEEVVGTRRNIRQRRGQFKEFTDLSGAEGITGDYGGKINRRIAPYRYGERDPKFFKDTGVRQSKQIIMGRKFDDKEKEARPYTSIFVGDDEKRNFQRTIEEIMNTPTYLEDQRFFRRPIPAIPIYIDKDGNYRSSGKNAIVSKEEFDKVAKKYIVSNEGDVIPSKVKPTAQMLRKDGNMYLVSVLKERPPKAFKEGGMGPRILTKRGATGSNPDVFEGRVEPSDYKGLQTYPTGSGPSLVGGKGVDFPLDAKELKEDLEKRALTRGDTGLLSLDGERLYSNMKKEYERKYGSMSRAQQRKLGRIVKNKITKPIRIGRGSTVPKTEKITKITFTRSGGDDEISDFGESYFYDNRSKKQILLKNAPKELKDAVDRRLGIKVDIRDKYYYQNKGFSNRVNETKGRMSEVRQYNDSELRNHNRLDDGKYRPITGGYEDERLTHFYDKDTKAYSFYLNSKKVKAPRGQTKIYKTKYPARYQYKGGGKDLYGESEFTMKMTGRGGGNRFYTMKEKDKKLEWWQRGKNQSEVSKRIDAESVPPQQYQLRGIRDPRSAGGRIIPPRNVRQISHSQTYKSARDEALIQMRINESAGVRGAKKKIEEVRHSEAEKRKNLVLARKTAEETAKGLKAKNAGLTHSYAVNVRNHSNATLLGSDPDELNKIIRRGGGLALLKDMVRKGEITDLSTISQLDLSVRNKNALIKLLNEGGEFVEGNEYFYRFIDDFGNTKVARGYLNKGGDRALNLDLMYVKTNDDGTTTKERRLVPKKNIISPEVSATTTSSGKQQRPRGERRLREAELEAFGLDLGDTPAALAEVGPSPSLIPVDRKTRGRSGERDLPAGEGILSVLRNDGDGLIGGESPRVPSPPTSEEDFQFAVPEPEPELASGGTMYGKSPKAQRKENEEFDAVLEAEIDDFVEQRSEGLGPSAPPSFGESVEDGMADFVAFELGGELPEQPSESFGEASPSAQSFIAGDTSLEELIQSTLSLEEEEPPKPPTPKKAKTPTGDKPKRVQFDLGEEETSFTDESEGFSSNYSGYDFTSSLPSDDIVETNLERKGKKERLGELLGDNEIFLWSTKYGGDSNTSKKGIILNRDDIGALARASIGQSVLLENGKTGKINKKRATKLYLKVLKDLNAGKQETAFNDEGFVRLFGIAPRL